MSFSPGRLLLCLFCFFGFIQDATGAPYRWMLLGSGVAQRLNYETAPTGGSIGSEGRFGVGVGLQRGIPLSRLLHFEFGLYYQRRISRVITESSTGEVTDQRYVFKSLDVPLQLRIYVLKERISLGGGILVSQGIGGVEISGAEVSYDSLGFNKMNLQLVGGISFQPKFGNKIGLIGIQGSYGLVNIGAAGSAGSISTTSLQVLVGVGI
jgi:hypothetical protein